MAQQPAVVQVEIISAHHSSDGLPTTFQGAQKVNEPVQPLTSIELCPSQAPLSLQVTQLCSLWHLRLQFQHPWLVLQHPRHRRVPHPQWQCPHPCPLHCPLAEGLLGVRLGPSTNPQDWLQHWLEPNYVKFIGWASVVKGPLCLVLILVWVRNPPQQKPETHFLMRSPGWEQSARVWWQKWLQPV